MFSLEVLENWRWKTIGDYPTFNAAWYVGRNLHVQFRVVGCGNCVER